jgi:cysteine-S-conjugate beta-lyase
MGHGCRYTQSTRCGLKAPSGSKKSATILVQGGRSVDHTGAVVNPPVWRASTHLYDNVAALEAGKSSDDDRSFFYGRRGSPTQWALEDALTALEPGACGTMLYPSGVAAIAGALLSVLRPGDVLLMADNAYDPSRHLANSMLKRLGIETRYFDPMMGADISTLFCPNTRAILMESPGSLTFEVQDVPVICAAAKTYNKGRGIVTLMDNTWATPLLFTALEKGVDMAILAATKYVVGHSDVMLGTVTTHSQYWKQLRQVVSPDDAFLASRGLRTMGVRMQAHQASALKIAHWLAGRQDVVRVLHPAMSDAVGNAIWKRDFTGSSGLFSFVLNGDKAAADRFVDALSHFGIGYSWGGFESLALPIHPEKFRSATSWPSANGVVRLQIGLEDADDLIADLEQAFAVLPL